MSENKLTPAEWEIMECIWNMGKSVSVRDVLEQGFSDGRKAYTTVQTIMNILVKKEQLKSEKIGLVNFYKPLKSRDAMIKVEMTSLISRVFKGSVPAMASYLMDSGTLKTEDIEEMRELLRKKERELSIERAGKVVRGLYNKSGAPKTREGI